MPVEVKLVQTDEEMRECLNLRTAVFVEEQNVDPKLEFDGEDGDCVHLIATIDKKPAGTARLRIKHDDNNQPYGKVQRVCVSQAARSYGIGAKIMDFSIEYFTDATKVGRIKLDAQVSAFGFYEKLGFKTIGPEFLDAGIRHKQMILELKRS